jgi:transposase
MDAQDKIFGEIEAALSNEPRRWVARRLTVVAMVLKGTKYREIEKQIGVDAASISAWMKIVRASGWRALTRHGRSEAYLQKRFDQATRGQLRADIQEALQEERDAVVHKRLVAVERLLSGEPSEFVCRDSNVERTTVRRWLQQVEQGGVSALFERKPRSPRDIGAASDELKGLSITEGDLRTKKALSTLAHVAEGKSIFAASILTGAARETTKRALARFQAGGLKTLRRVPTGRPVRLSAEQLAELKALIDERRDISYAELVSYVASHFAVAYCENGLKRLLSRELGLRRYRGVFRLSSSNS